MARVSSRLLLPHTQRKCWAPLLKERFLIYPNWSFALVSLFAPIFFLFFFIGVLKIKSFRPCGSTTRLTSKLLGNFGEEDFFSFASLVCVCRIVVEDFCSIDLHDSFHSLEKKKFWLAEIAYLSQLGLFSLRFMKFFVVSFERRTRDEWDSMIISLMLYLVLQNY